MAHAILSPSGSGTWLQCPASIRMCRDLPRDEGSVYALEGTQFHLLCEVTARYRLLGGSEEDYIDGMIEWATGTADEWQEDQLRYVEHWIAFLRDVLDEEPGATLHLERRVDTGVPGCWGTADVTIEGDSHLRVIDIKYGQGIRVDAEDNSQLKLYGLGALGLVENPTKIHEVIVTVWQPRMNNISDFTITRKKLEAWREEITPIAQLALSEDAPFGPSESACRFCPAAGICKARTRYLLDQDFGNPDFLTGEEMAEAYARTSELKRWIADIEDAALKRAYEEAGSVPGYKVVRSGGRRKIMDEAKAIDVLIKAGYDEDDVASRKIATLGELDKLAGDADKLQQVLGDLLVKSEGRLSLAPDSDPRPPADAVHSAQEDFADITNEGEA